MNPPAEDSIFFPTSPLTNFLDNDNKEQLAEEVVLVPVSKGKFMTNFPRATNYSNMADINKSFPNLKYVNSETFDYKRVNYADFYVIKSTNDDDVHKVRYFL